MKYSIKYSIKYDGYTLVTKPIDYMGAQFFVRIDYHYHHRFSMSFFLIRKETNLFEFNLICNEDIGRFWKITDIIFMRLREISHESIFFPIKSFANENPQAIRELFYTMWGM